MRGKRGMKQMNSDDLIKRLQDREPYKELPGTRHELEAALGGAVLTGADLVQADLSGLRIFGAVLVKADLTGARLRKTDLNGCFLDGANLTQVLLAGALGNGREIRSFPGNQAGTSRVTYTSDQVVVFREPVNGTGDYVFRYHPGDPSKVPVDWFDDPSHLARIRNYPATPHAGDPRYQEPDRIKGMNAEAVIRHPANVKRFKEKK